MRLIDADELITAFPANEGGVDVKICSVRGTINNMPTIEAEPVRHGHWEVAIGYDPRRSFQCSECGKMAFENSRFCPICGAKVEDNK